MAEAQFTPDVAKQAVRVAASPEAAIVGTANPVLDAARVRYSAGQAEASLKVISGEVVPYTERDVNRVLLWNLSSERDAVTGEKKNPTNANEDQRFRESKILAESARKFIESGSIDATLRAPLITFLSKNSPAVGDVIAEVRASGGNAAVNAFVDSLIKTPGFRDNLRTLFIGRLNPTRRLAQEGTVKQLELDIANLQAQLGTEVTQAQVDAARVDLDTAKAALLPHTAEQIQLQTKTARYQELSSEMSVIKRELRTYKGEGEPLAIELSALETEKAGLDPVVDAARVTAIDARTQVIKKNGKYLNYSSRKAEVDEHTALVGEIATLQVVLEPFQQDIVKKQEALTAMLDKQKTNITPKNKAELQAQIAKKNGELADARTMLEAEMIKFYQEVTHMPADAMEQHLNAAFSTVKTMWKEEATKQAATDTTEEGKIAALAIDKVQNIWKTSTTKGRLTFFRPDRDKARVILDEAFKAGGGENIAIYLETQTNVALGLTAAEHAALKAKLTDPAFRKAQSEGLAKQALADYLMAGGRLNGDLVKSLATTEFGRALITEARAKADAAIQQYKDQFGKSVLDGGTRFAEFMKTGKWWMIGAALVALMIFLAAKAHG